MLPTTPHPTATIIREGVFDNPEYRFNHIRPGDVWWSSTSGPDGVYDCNVFFPRKRGYAYDDNCKKPPHPDDNYSFFFWRDYNTIEEYTKNDDEEYDPEWLRSNHDLFVFDGTVNCWNGSTPDYPDCIDEWDDGYFDHTEQGHRVPIACLPMDEETPTDRDRRLTYYRQHTCIWALRECNCNSNGAPCHKVETEYYKTHGPCICGFGDYHSHSDDESDADDNESDDNELGEDHPNNGDEGWRTWSLGTNMENTLGARMARIGVD